MSKIIIIIQREYLSRVKKKSFIIMTILGPILFAGIGLIPLWFSKQDETMHLVEVLDRTEPQIINGFLKDSKNIHYVYRDISLADAQNNFYKKDLAYTDILYIPENILNKAEPEIYYKSNPGIGVEERIRTAIEDVLYETKLEGQGIELKDVDSARIPVNILTKKQPEQGEAESTYTGVSMFVGFGAGILIYIFIFLYGIQVMQGVIEEKTSRIVEVIISSVKPFQLMMGKIIGIAMVGLTQFVLWVTLTSVLWGVGQVSFLKDSSNLKNPALQQNVIPSMPNQMKKMHAVNSSETSELVKEVKQGIEHLNFIKIILCFLFYFLGGYLLYSAMFAAIGSAIDNDADKQQFMMPITIPLVISFIAAQFIMQNPETPLAFWFSVIPFTSPIVMMVRLPFEVPAWELALSMTILVITFILMTWLAGKIYRTGILMYGKKVSYKELWKWLRYSG